MLRQMLQGVIFSIILTAQIASAQPASISPGIDWLVSHQNADKSWGGDPSSLVLPFQATSEVIAALQLHGRTGTQYFNDGLTWLNGEIVDTVNAASKRLTINTIAQLNLTTDQNLIISWRNTEGSWGIDADYSNEAFQTASALQALKSANYTDHTLIYNAINYLLTTQNTDGGWGFVPGDDSNVYITAQVLSTLAQFTGTYLTGQQLTSAANFLLSKQNPDGGFGVGSSTVYETALAFIALSESGQTQGLPLQNAVNYLITTQLPNGSWNDDPYPTALALRALAHVKPDLAITATNLAVSPNNPTVGNNVTVTSTVGNIGMEAASGVVVRLLDNGVIVGEQTIPAINSGATVPVVYSVAAIAPAGEHIFSVAIDPGNLINEMSKANNSATVRIWVKALADLVVLPEYLTISPLYPKPGDNITLTAKIANMGESATGAFVADLYDGNPNSGGTKLGSFSLTGIAAGEWGTGSVVFSIAAEGQHILYLVVDPQHAVTELSTQNNTAQKTINVTSLGNGYLNDLAIPMNGIQISPQRPHSGDNVTVTLLALNLGAETTTADLELFDGDPANGGILLHKSTVALSAGETRTVTVAWQISAGIHTLRAYIDRANKIAERDKTNNSRALVVMADMVDIEVSASDIVIEPEHPMADDPATVKVTVQNRGISSTGPFNVNLYNGDPNSGGTLLQSFAVADLAGDATRVISYPFTAARGTYRFYVVCDPEKVVPELSEDNNIAIRSLLVKTSAEAMGPDLVPIEFDLSATTTDPQTLRISGTAKVKFQNKGDDKVATPFRIMVFEDKDNDGVYTEGTDLALGFWDYSTAMNPNMVGIVNINVEGTLTFRDAPIYAMVDSGQAVFEQNETNNTIRKGSACESQPANPIEPVVKWKSSLPKSLSVNGGPDSSPIIVNLTDDNGDGKIDAKDIPAVVFSLTSNRASNPKMVALRGDTGQLMFTTPNDPIYYQSGDPDFIAAGDLDGDGKIELLAIRMSSQPYLIAYNNDGTVKWNNQQAILDWNAANFPRQITVSTASAPAIADLDADGNPEIIVGATVFNAADGSVKWGPPRSTFLLGRGALTGNWESVIVADLDLDGKQEVIAGNTAYNYDGTVKWFNQSLSDGVNAVVKFDDDPYPSVVLVTVITQTSEIRGPRVYLLDHNGQIKWGPVYLRDLDPAAQSAGTGGAPLIADFDGDGEPEIGVKGIDKYFILDKNGRLKQTLSIPYQSDGCYSSPTVFDLNGDGRPEVIINSDGFFRIFDGRSGALLYQEAFGVHSGNSFQNVVVADVDGDGHAELVAFGKYILNDDSSIRVYGAKNNDWVNTRRIWNQASYHVTNINDDGSIPHYEAPSCLTNNNYRCQVPTSTGPNPYLAADLSASYVRVDMVNYPASVKITARIGNGGAKAVAAGVKSSFHNGDPANNGDFIGSVLTSKALNPGEYEDVTLVWASPAEGNHTIYINANSDNSISECDKTNNAVTYPVYITSVLPDLAINLQINPQRPHAGETVTASLLARNIGNIAATADLELFEGDPNAGGIALHTSAVTLNAGETRTVTVPWLMPSGIHTLRAYIDRANKVAERDETNNSQVLTVMADMVDIEISASDILIEPEHPMDGDSASVKLTVQNRGIAPTGPFNLNLYNGDPANGGVLLQSFAIADLAGDAKRTVNYPFTAVRGTYRFYAVCDPEKVVPELSEDNNIAIRSLLVKSSSEAKGPDLVPLEFDLSTANTDFQRLRISGTAKVRFQNKGDDKVSTPFRIMVFEDKDNDGVYTEGTDLPLGFADYSVPMNPNMVGVVNINLSGTLTFRDAPIYAMVDSGQSVFEQNETNNTIRKGSACEVRPANPIEPVVKWRWKGSQMTTPPVVMNLTDTNGDGKIDDKDIPNIAFTHISLNAQSTLRSLRGDTGQEIFSYFNNIHPIGSRPFIAAGDIDGDGLPELVMAEAPPNGYPGLLAFDHDGTLKWDNNQNVKEYLNKSNWITINDAGQPLIADLYGDGKPVIVMGATVINADGSIRWVANDYKYGSGFGASYLTSASSVVVDLDLNGKNTIVAGNTAYNSDGTTKWWNKSIPDGVVAIGNFNDDPYPEIVLVAAGGKVYLLDHNGNVIWGPLYVKDLENDPSGTAYVPGSLPVIADFDGDGESEIGLTGFNKYLILDKNGNLKNTLLKPYNDDYAGTMPTIFDLNGDGHPEVIFNSINYFKIFDGKDGTLLYKELFGGPYNSHFQTIIVADVDGDGHAEIVAAGGNKNNNDSNGDALRVYGAKNNDWVNTRRIWNQASYHVTNINDDGSIPQYETPSWLTNNNYRCQVPTSTGPNPYQAADLSASYIRVDMAGYPASVTVTARIGNGGAKAVPAGVRTAFYDGNPANGGIIIGSVLTSKTLNPGDYEDVSVVMNAPTEGNHTIYLNTDADATVVECDKTNNTLSLPVYITSGKPDLSVVAEDIVVPSTIPEGSLADITVTIRNIGTIQADNVLVRLFAGNPAAGGKQIGSDRIIPAIAAGGAATVRSTWNTLGAQGTTWLYAVVDPNSAIADMNRGNNTAVKEVQVTPAIKPDLQIAAEDITISPATPLEGDKVTITATVHNRGTATGNIPVRIYLGNPLAGGFQVADQTIFPILAQGSATTLQAVIDTTGLAGQRDLYVVVDPANIIAESREDNNSAVKQLLIQSANLASSIVLDKPAYQAGEAVTASISAVNATNNTRTLLLNLSIKDSNSNVVAVVSSADTITVGPNSSVTVMRSWNTGKTIAGTYTAAAELSEGSRIVSRSSTGFTINGDKRINAKVTVDKITYLPRENATINGVITSQSSNYIFENLTVETKIIDPYGATLFNNSKNITMLTPEASYNFKYYWNTDTFAPGNYSVAVEVLDATGAVIATGNQTLVIGSIVKPSALLKGGVTVDKQSVLAGEIVNVSTTVTNTGNVDLQNVNLSLLTVNLAENAVYDTLTYQTPLPMGGSYANTGLIDTTGHTAKDYLVVLRAAINGVEETIGSGYFRVEGAPSAPSLAGPANGSDVETFTPVLSINNASDPNDDKLTYEFELYGDSGLTNLVVSSGALPQGNGLTSWSVSLPLLENLTCYWRARAYDGQLYGPWMTPASFRVNMVNEPPTAPILTSPTDNTSTASLTPVLTVTNATDPDSVNLTYNFDIALDLDFTQIAASVKGVAGGQGTTSWTLPTPLQENVSYYWRAQADDWQIEGPWSAVSRFFVNTVNDAPSIPVITAPLNGVTIKSMATDVVVTNSTDPDSSSILYYFEVDTTPTFDSTGAIRSGGISEGSGTTLWHLSGLKDNTRYYLRVKASDGISDSPWSEVSWFFANTVNDPPTTPALANPSNGAGVSVFTPTLSVHNATDPDNDILTYEFEILPDAAMPNPVQSGPIAETPLTTGWTVPISLKENQMYYWRARVFDGSLYSNWTPTASFTVNTANDAPGAPQLSSPANGGSVATLTPVLAVKNAYDPDGASLTYTFEIYSGASLVTTVNNMPQNNSGVTSITLSTALSDNTQYQWRARAYDGDRYGPWMNMANFTVHLSNTNIGATINFDPDTLNKQSNGNWVTVFIELPAGYKASDINISSVRLEGTIPAETRPYELGDYDKDGISDLMVKFSRSAVINLLPNGDRVPVHVTGKVGSTTFEGVDIIRVIQK